MSRVGHNPACVFCGNVHTWRCGRHSRQQRIRCSACQRTFTIREAKTPEPTFSIGPVVKIRLRRALAASLEELFEAAKGRSSLLQFDTFVTEILESAIASFRLAQIPPKVYGNPARPGIAYRPGNSYRGAVAI
jgi:hypothetical protein